MQRELRWSRASAFAPNLIGELNLGGRLGLAPQLPPIRNAGRVTRLLVGNNPMITSLDCRAFTALEWLHAADCSLGAMPNLSACRALTQLTLQYNKLTELDVSGLPSLALLNVCHNELARLELCTQDAPQENGSHAGSLRQVAAAGNRLTHLGALPACLQHLDVSHNALEALPALPATLGHLNAAHNALAQPPVLPAALAHLDLSHNALEDAPALPWPARPGHIDLSWNRLTALPGSYAEATFHLDVSHNPHLAALPNFVADKVVAHNCGLRAPFSFRGGDMVDMVDCPLAMPVDLAPFAAVIMLTLEGVGLTGLPDTLGELSRLMVLSVSHNPLLERLPPSLADCAQLRELSLADTGVTAFPPRLHESTTMTTIVCDASLRPEADRIVAAASEARRREDEARRQEAHANQPQLVPLVRPWQGKPTRAGALQRWADMTGRPVPALPDSGLWGEWLWRLEGSSEFTWQRADMAPLVMDMLAHASAHPDFCDTMLLTLEHDLAACGDRAAMSFNQLHTAYRVHALVLAAKQERAPVREVVREYAQLARTLCLRRRVGQLMSQHARSAMDECVEVYLYAEVQLRDRLQLATGVHRMTYDTLGARSWLHLDDLVAWVRRNHKHDLFDALDAQRAALEACLASERFPWEPAGDWDARLDAIEQANDAGRFTTQDYVRAMNGLMEERKQALAAQRAAWLERHADWLTADANASHAAPRTEAGQSPRRGFCEVF